MVYKDGLKTIRLWRSRCPGTLSRRKNEEKGIPRNSYTRVQRFFNNLMAQTRQRENIVYSDRYVHVYKNLISVSKNAD
jgi:hypothetical protein